MRFALWRNGKDRKSPPNTVSAPVVAPSGAASPQPGDLDVRAIWRALMRKKRAIIIPTLLAFVLSLTVVNLITPRYKSEARILIDGRENVFLRPNGERNDERNALDPEAVASQVQLVLSRDLAREVIEKNKLAQNPEFDPVLRGVSPIRSLLALFGIGRDPLRMTPEERVLDAYYSRLTAYAVNKSRVIVIEFQSRDPELAARIANSIADGYLVLQMSARQEQAKTAGQWLSGEIDSLRKKVSDAESRVEDFRSKSSLFIGTNNTSLSNQQLGEINTQLNNARALKSDAESKARLIRGMLQSGKPIEASEVLNSELMRRLQEQRVTLRAQLAEQSSTLLGQHPRIKELKAQLADLDHQIREEAEKISRSLENDARIASGRVESLSNSLDQLKKQATSSNGDDVKLRALEREARAERDLLESYLAKYREATTRENIDAAPSDGRIISRGIVSNTPAYPKKLPIVLIATLATLMLTAGIVATGELLRITAPRAPAAFDAVAPRAEVAPAPREIRSEPAVDLIGIDRLANDLRIAGESARKVTLMGTGRNESVMQSALALARLLAQNAKVVLVDLSLASSTLTAASVDPTAPGVAELMLGEASFGQVISRDGQSPLHLVLAGRSGIDRALLQSPRLTIALDALLRVYDHVLLAAGTATDLPAKLLTDQARAIVVPDPSMTAEARARLSGQLTTIGFASVTMLDPVSLPPEIRTDPREAA
ncbi:MAG: lipopolysaccharide biosynthesis [Nitrobacter sp.]|uniref:GumC family protein n=1 Tax=Nitrobacter sp. TaxID=29420 RepID=UPI00387DE0B3